MGRGLSNFRGYTGPTQTTTPNRPSFNSSQGTYTPGGDSFKNYSQQDQKKMFDAAGGKNQFIKQASDIEQGYKRSMDTQRYLNQVNQFNKGVDMGGRVKDGRLQMIGADGILRDSLGRQILSMQSPYMTAQAPTFGQFMGDVGRGISNIAGAFAEKGGPLISLGKNLLSGIQNLFSGTPGAANVPVFPVSTGGGGGGGIDPMMQAQTDAYNALNATQKSVYDMLIKTLPHAEALRQAQAQGLPKPVGYMPNYAGLARGGVANL